MSAEPEVVVDLHAFRRNLDRLRERVAPADVMVVVKDDAYSHGLIEIATAAVHHGIRRLGALDVGTALALRAGGIPPEVCVFAWQFDPGEDLGPAVAAGIELGVSSLRQLESIAKLDTGAPARVHLKIDTGLHRNGATAQDWPALVARAAELRGLGLIDPVGAWTHLAEASYDEDTEAMARFAAALDVASGLGVTFPVRHLGASAAAHSRADSRFDMVRIGAFSYGIAPGDGIGPGQIGLDPVMSLTAVVSAVDTTRAHVAIGFGDGLLGALGGRAAVAIRGRLHRIIEVQVDALVVEADGGDIRPGDDVTLFGPGHAGEQTLQEWADAMGTIGEEIVVRLSPRLRRRYVGLSE